MDSTFSKLYKTDISKHVEKKDKLSYLSWSWAWAEIMNQHPDAAFDVKHWDGKPYLFDSDLGYMVETSVTIDGVTRSMFLPVMDSANKAMKSEPYTYRGYDRFKKSWVDKSVDAATMFDINKTIMRCLVKNIALFGLGLCLYNGEDLPDDSDNSTSEKEPKWQLKPATPAATTTTKSTKSFNLRVAEATSAVELNALDEEVRNSKVGTDEQKTLAFELIRKRAIELGCTYADGEGWISNQDLFGEQL